MRTIVFATAISVVFSAFVPDASFGYVKKEGDYEGDEEMVGEFTQEKVPVKMKAEVDHRPKGLVREEGETIHRAFKPKAPVDYDDYEKVIPEQARLKVGRSKGPSKPASTPQSYKDEDEGQIQTIADFLHQDDDDEPAVMAKSTATINEIGVVSAEEEMRIDDRGAEDVLKRRRIRDLQAAVSSKDGQAGGHQSQAQKRAMENIKKMASQRAETKAQKKQEVEAATCPPVYVYDMPKELGGWKATGKSIHEVFGDDLVATDGTKSMPGAFNTPEDSLMRILLYRLRTSKDCAQVDDPNKASLYLVPLFPEADGPAWVPLCNTLRHTDWRRALPHLNKQTVERHVFVVPHNDNKGKIPCGEWWANPSPTLLKSAVHLIVDSPAGDIPLPPHMMYVPRPASIHWASEFGMDEAPWKKGKARRSLVSYFGGIHGPDESRILRKFLKDQCNKDKSCFMIVKESGHAKKELTRQYAAQVLRAKRESVFCLEPPGSTIGRKSIMDSLLMGCIPVLFDKKQEGLYAWHWTFKKYSRILIDLDPSCTVPWSKLTQEQRESPTRADDCDVMKRLRKIPTAEVAHSQEVIAKYAHKMQYSLKDGIRGDAFEVLFTKIHQDASDRYAKKYPSKNMNDMVNGLKEAASGTNYLSEYVDKVSLSLGGQELTI